MRAGRIERAEERRSSSVKADRLGRKLAEWPGERFVELHSPILRSFSGHGAARRTVRWLYARMLLRQLGKIAIYQRARLSRDGVFSESFCKDFHRAETYSTLSRNQRTGPTLRSRFHLDKFLGDKLPRYRINPSCFLANLP